MPQINLEIFTKHANIIDSEILRPEVIIIVQSDLHNRDYRISPSDTYIKPIISGWAKSSFRKT